MYISMCYCHVLFENVKTKAKVMLGYSRIGCTWTMRCCSSLACCRCWFLKFSKLCHWNKLTKTLVALFEKNMFITILFLFFSELGRMMTQRWLRIGWCKTNECKHNFWNTWTTVSSGNINKYLHAAKNNKTNINL